MNLTDRLNENKISYVLNEPMSAHTTFKIGGAADIMITVQNADELKTAVSACKASDTPYMILGNGSNLLVSDDGIEGAVIVLDGSFKEIAVDGPLITAGAGAKLSKLCTVALDEGLGGLEFAYGIPGSVGGAVFMNAGAYGGEMKDVIVSVTALSADGEVHEVPAEDCAFGYRTSVFKTSGEIILFSKYQLHTDDKNAIKERMDDVMGRRKSKQPLEYPSAGSVIEQCGLKGTTVGGAQVSEKNAGFIINIGGATCDDVMNLVKLVQDTVKAETGFWLEREIIRTGR